MKKGFTLIELLVVIAIIGLLSSIIFAAVSEARKKGEDTQVISIAHEIKNASNSQYYSTGKVPGETNLDPSFISTAGPLASKVTDLVSGGYIKQLPTNSTHYIYYWYYSDVAKNDGIVTYKCENDNVTKYINSVWSDRSLNLPRMKYASTNTYVTTTSGGVVFNVYCMSYL